MKKYFPFDSINNSQLYRSIADTLKEFYPMGISPFQPEYREFPGIKKMEEIFGENIVNNKNYKKRWVGFINKLGKESGKEINGTTCGMAPGFSADLILEKHEDGDLMRIKRIAFAVSLLGPFFSICGIDETFIKEKYYEFARSYHAINVVTVSPYKEFEADFNGIKYWIEKSFPNYKLVPFEVCMMYLKDVETPNSIGQECTVYNALFNHLFNFYTHYHSRGERFYGLEKNPNIKVTLSRPPKPD